MRAYFELRSPPFTFDDPLWEFVARNHVPWWMQVSVGTCQVKSCRLWFISLVLYLIVPSIIFFVYQRLDQLIQGTLFDKAPGKARARGTYAFGAI